MNDSKSEVTVQNLQVEVTGPDKLTVLFKWNWFYDFRPSPLPKEREIKATGEAKAFGIAPGQMIAMGVQFTAPQSDSGRLWVQGDFTFELSGSYNADQKLKTTFTVRLDAKEAGDVITLRGANKAFWDRWSDSDRAIGIPARIVAAATAVSVYPAAGSAGNRCR